MENQASINQTVINIPFPVIRINCKKCKSSFSLLAFAGNTWIHQKPAGNSPVFCPYCKEGIYE
jgi:hypothetical protein